MGYGPAAAPSTITTTPASTTQSADAFSNAGAIGQPVVAFLEGSNGSLWERVRVNGGGSASGTGKLTVLTGVIPVTSLNAASAVGAGSAQDYRTAFQNWSMQVVVVQGTISALKVYLELSLNGVNYFRAGVWDMAAGPQASGDIVSVLNKPASFARAYLDTITGTSSPQVTALITGVP